MMEHRTIPRPEYPRPDFQRDHWQNLNGRWEFAFDDANAGEAEHWQDGKRPFGRTITVPFCYQSELSGICDSGLHEYMWYRRSFDLEDGLREQRVLLRFGAVDTVAKVWLNGEYLGMHCGGYTPFSFDITALVRERENILVVKAEDSYECSKPRGKQFWNEVPNRCWYIPTSGIWQTVWLEAVGEVYLDKVRLTPDIDRKCVEVEFYFHRLWGDVTVDACLTYEGHPVRKVTASVDRRITRLTIDVREEDYVHEVHHWWPEHPSLYDLELTVRANGIRTDHVRTYFGMRKISVSGKKILLNNMPYYQRLVLDQGYWPESSLTPPSDEAIKQDILAAKRLGFNGARKHQKIEDPRYYYWADKLGLLVWGEMPSAYSFDTEEMETLLQEWGEFINRDYNHPCIAVWVPLNESWGVRNIYTDRQQQAFACGLYHMTRALDPTRLVNANDGWEQIDDDFCGIHDYAATGDSFRARYQDLERLFSADAQFKMAYAQGYKYSGGPVLITEYGGITFREGGGYNRPAKTEEEFVERFRDITRAIQNLPDVCGYCYTQLADVQQEVNGLLTAQRIMKVDPQQICDINLSR